MLRQASSARPLTLSQSSSYVRVVLRVSKSYKRSPVTSTSSSPPDLYHFKQVKKTNVALWLYDLIYWSIKISYVIPLSESLHIRPHRIWARSLGSEFHWLWIVRTTHHVYRVSRYLYIYTVYTCVYSIIITYVIELDLTARLWFPCFCVNTYKRLRLLDCAARIQSEAW